MDDPLQTHLPEYFAFITSFITLVVMLWKQYSDNKKANAETKKTEADSRKSDTEAADTISDAAITLVGPQTQRIRELLEENKKLKRHTLLLQKQIRVLGGEPVPQPNGNGE